MKQTSTVNCQIFTALLALAGGMVPLMAADALPPSQIPDAALTIAKGQFKPDWESLKQYRTPDWFRDAKFGIWICWNAYTLPGCGDWYARNMYVQGDPMYDYHVKTYGHPSKVGYKDIIQLWKGENYDPDRLVSIFKETGAKYLVVMANHHDNFDLWDSKYHQWNSVNYGPKKDIVGLFRAAVLKQGLRFGITTHAERTWSWFQTNKGADKTGPLAGVPYDGNDPKYQDLYLPKDPNGDSNQAHPLNAPEFWRRDWLARMIDVIDRYHPDLSYVDGGVPFYGDDKGQTGINMIAHLYNRNASWHHGVNEAVMCIKNWERDGQFGYYKEGVATLDREMGHASGIERLPWQTDTTIGDWTWRRDESYRPAADIIHELADNVSKNGNLLLNVSPRADGTLDTKAEELLKQIGAWMTTNGEAIYGTRPWQICGEGSIKGTKDYNTIRRVGEIRFTTKGTALYAIAYDWPADNKLVVHALANGSGKINKVSLLGNPGRVDWQQTPEGLVVTLPAVKLSDYANVLKIEGSDLRPVISAAEIATPQESDGRLMLSGMDAEIHGGSPFYDKGADQIGRWGNPEDFLSWELLVAKPGTFTVNVTYSCAIPDGEFTVETGDQKLNGKMQSTGSWAKYTTVTLGEVTLAAGKQMLTLKPKSQPQWQGIGFRSIELAPKAKQVK
jgi:alpha-L-fucosidase